MIAATSLPAGARVDGSRARVLPGASPVDEWMTMLSDRLDECVAILSPAPDHLRDTIVAWSTEGTIR